MRKGVGAHAQRGRGASERERDQPPTPKFQTLARAETVGVVMRTTSKNI